MYEDRDEGSERERDLRELKEKDLSAVRVFSDRRSRRRRRRRRTERERERERERAEELEDFWSWPCEDY